MVEYAVRFRIPSARPFERPKSTNQPVAHAVQRIIAPWLYAISDLALGQHKLWNLIAGLSTPSTRRGTIRDGAFIT